MRTRGNNLEGTCHLPSGITNLFEGFTISYPDPVGENLKIFATSSYNHPCMLCADIRTSKIMKGASWWIVASPNCSAIGTQQALIVIFVTCVWLLGLEHKLKLGLSLQGPMKQIQTEDHPLHHQLRKLSK
ncbi:hypothetical protein QOT17_008304 [Balamuthia mandrillaris]